MANQLSIANVINISVVSPGAGLLPWNTSNLALFTHDTCSNGAVTSAGYGIYLDPVSVATDWGSASTTTLMAQAVFNQQPNILAGNGALVIIPFASSGEYLDIAIARVSPLVQFFGIISAQIEKITEGSMYHLVAIWIYLEAVILRNPGVYFMMMLPLGVLVD